MTKKHFIALADVIKHYNRNQRRRVFTRDQMVVLAQFCMSQNRGFNMERWLDYIAGKCGPNGGSVERRPRRNRSATEAGTELLRNMERLGATYRADATSFAALAATYAAPTPVEMSGFIVTDFAELDRRAAHIADAVAYTAHTTTETPAVTQAETPVLTPAEIRVPSPVPSLEDSINFLRSR